MSILHRFAVVIAVVSLTIGISGCSNPFEDPLKKYINDHFPPVTESGQRAKAIDSAAKTLALLTSPNLALSAQFADVQRLLKNSDLTKQGVTELLVDGKEQLVRVRVKFARKFTEADAGKDENIRKLLARLQPDVEGNIEAYAGVTSSLASSQAAGSTLTFKLLPAIANIEVTKVTMAGKYDLTATGEVLVRLLTVVKDNIAGQLANNPLTTVTIPALSNESMDASRLISSDAKGMKMSIQVKGNPVSVPFKLDGVALLVSDTRFTALAQLTPTTTTTALPAPVASDFGSIKERVNTLLTHAFSIPDNDTANWVAVRKDLLALALNMTTAQADVCAVVTASTPNEHTSSKVTIPKGSSLSCSADFNCVGHNNCTWHSEHTDFSCSKCLIPNINRLWGGGGCVQMGNDPICEANKAAINAGKDAEANLRKAGCDADNAQQVAVCQASANAKIALCQTAKAALDGIALTGSDFANFDTDSSASTNGLKICIQNVNVAPDLSKVSFALNLSGDAQAKINVKFEPLNVVGHMVCHFGWSKEQTFNAALSQTLPVTTGMSFNIDAQGNQALIVAIDPIDTHAKLSPGPTEYLLKSPQLLASCPIVAGFAPLVVAATPFVPQLRGEINYKTPASTLNVVIPSSRQTIGTSTLAVTVKNLPLALQGVGTLAAAR